MSELKRTYLQPLVLFTVLLCAGFSGFSQGVTPTKGKDFWMGFMKNYETEAGESLDLFIVSDVSTSGTVSVPGQSWTFPFTVSPNATTTVSIPNSVAEMYSNQVVEGRGVHIETQDTVAVFAISFNPYTADGTKVLPTPSLGTSYMAAAYAGLSPWDSELLIVATEDDTEVEIIPSVVTAGGNAAGVAFTVSLDQGDSYQVMSAPGLDLTGTIVRATEASGSCRPFAVFSGAGCTNIPSGCIACDHIYEQNWPLEVWGTEYFVTPFVFDLNPLYPVAEANYTYRILASVNGTSVSVDGGAPFVLNAGQFQEFQYEPDPHCIDASQPVAVIQYMEGISCGGNGDPAMLILDDVSKKIDNITFSTVQSTVITSHYLNVVIDASDLGNITLDGVTIDPALFADFPGCPGQLWAGFEITPGSHTLDAPGGGVTGYVYGNGEAESYAYSVGSFSPIPPIDIDDAFCTNDAVTLQIAGNYTNPYWYNYTDPGTILFEGYTYVLPEPVQNGVYVGVGGEFISGCEEEFYFSVEVPTPPVISLTAGDINICQYESVQLNAAAQPANAVYYYEWTPGYALSDDEIANPIATPLITTTYTVTVTTPTGCATNSASLTINVTDGNIARFEADPEEALFCVGDGVEMSVVTEQRIWSDDFNPGIAWGDWDTILNGAESTVCGSVSGNAMYFNGNGERSATTPPLDCADGGTVYFSLKIANGTAPCDNAESGDNIILEYSTDGVIYTPIQTYFESAYPDFISVSQPVPVAAQTANTRFRWRQLGTFANNQDNWVLDDCYIGAVRTDDFTYSWTPAAGLSNTTESTVLASPSVVTMYYVELSDALTGCTYTDSVFVNVGQPFALQMSPDIVLCDVQGVELSATPDVGGLADYTFEWTPSVNITGAFTATPTVTPGVTTTYFVTVTSEQGCVAEDSVTVVVNTLLDLDVSVSDNLICAGEEITLSAAIDGDPDDIAFSWTPVVSLSNPTSAVTTATPEVTTTYVMEATHIPSGCALSESVLVTVQPTFEVTVSPDFIENCTTQGIPIAASSTFNGPLTWSWTPAANVSAANQPNVTLTQNASVDLIVTATNSAGCSASDQVTVIYYIETTDIGQDSSICIGQSVLLDTGWPDTYTFDWNNGAASSAITVTQTGTYSVTVTSPLGCISTDQVEIEVFEYPELELGLAVALCEGESYTISAGGPELNYVWSTGETTPEITVTTTGQYFVTADNGVCESTDGVSILFNPLAVRPFAEEGTFCFGFPPYTLELDAANPGYTYVWNTGETGQVINVPAPGFIQVQITSDFGCSTSYGILIDEVCPGSVYIPNSFSPDGDGINDAWMVYGENIESLEVSIFNRWGEMFFWSNDINKPWIGQRRDGEHFVEPGAYVYLVKVRVRDEFGNVSDEMKYTGHVTIVR